MIDLRREVRPSIPLTWVQLKDGREFNVLAQGDGRCLVRRKGRDWLPCECGKLIVGFTGKRPILYRCGGLPTGRCQTGCGRSFIPFGGGWLWVEAK